MIGKLKGVFEEPDLLITKGGVGYVVKHCGTALTPGKRYNVYVTSVYKETSAELFSFDNREQQELFLALTKVSGVGPSISCNVLVELGVAAAVRALASGDVTALTKVSGVGKKMATTLTSMVSIPAGLEKYKSLEGAAVVDASGLAVLRSNLAAVGVSGDAVDAIAAQLTEDDWKLPAGELVAAAIRIHQNTGGVE